MPAKKKKKSRARRRSSLPQLLDETADQTTVDLSNDAEYEALIASMGGTDLAQLAEEPLHDPNQHEQTLSPAEITEQATKAVRQLCHAAFSLVMPARGGGKRSGAAQKRGKIRTHLTIKLIERETDGVVRDVLLDLVEQPAGQKMLDEIHAQTAVMSATHTYTFGNEKWSTEVANRAIALQNQHRNIGQTNASA